MSVVSSVSSTIAGFLPVATAAAYVAWSSCVLAATISFISVMYGERGLVRDAGARVAVVGGDRLLTESMFGMCSPPTVAPLQPSGAIVKWCGG